MRFFGRRVTHDHAGELELKAKKLLKKKVFKHASEWQPFPPDERTGHALSCIEEGAKARAEGREAKVNRQMLAGLAQAKLAFVKYVLQQLAEHSATAFASIVPAGAPRPQAESFLRKDYSYLFERIFYFLEAQPREPRGLVVFDELEKTQSHILVNQMKKYFQETETGRRRAGLVVPEPFFVHSDLTTLVQVADIVAYVAVWGLQVGHMSPPKRPELRDFAQRICDLRHRVERPIDGEQRIVYSFAIIDDLRPRCEQPGES
jgi:hypothetical protein